MIGLARTRHPHPALGLSDRSRGSQLASTVRLAGGAILILSGAKRGSLLGGLVAALGGALVMEGVNQRNANPPLKRARAVRPSRSRQVVAKSGDEVTRAPESGEADDRPAIFRRARRRRGGSRGDSVTSAPESGDVGRLSAAAREIIMRRENEGRDKVAEAGDESFPASDPPSFSPGKA